MISRKDEVNGKIQPLGSGTESNSRPATCQASKNPLVVVNPFLSAEHGWPLLSFACIHDDAFYSDTWKGSTKKEEHGIQPGLSG
jgi:hypothetical protein